MQLFNGIDVSVYNGDIDWERVKRSGVEFAIIRAGYGSYADQVDARFEANYSGAKAAGVPIGTYWYSYASTPQEAEQEAKAFLEVIKGKQFEYPVAYDVENRFQAQLDVATVDAIINTFCKYLENKNYFVSLYSYEDFLIENVSEETRKQYSLWVANIYDEPSLPYDIWQHSFDGVIDGIPHRTDLDKSKVDFPALIKSKGFNGYGKSAAQRYLVTLKQGTWYYRSGPGTNYVPLGTVSGGYKYDCTKLENGWYYCPPMGGWFGPAAIRYAEVIG